MDGAWGCNGSAATFRQQRNGCANSISLLWRADFLRSTGGRSQTILTERRSLLFVNGWFQGHPNRHDSSIPACHNCAMEPDGRTYLLPHPGFVRIIMTLAGAFVLCIAPYGLWRGVWPPNILSPFFGLIMCGGMAVGAGFLRGGLMEPSVRLYFSPGIIDVYFSYLWGESQQTIRAEDIEEFLVEFFEGSDSGDSWHATIKLKHGRPIMSRPLGTQETAERLLEEFKRSLSPEAGCPARQRSNNPSIAN